MQNFQVFLEEQHPLIKKVFHAYCIQNKIYLVPSTQKLLFHNLLQNLQANWDTKIRELKMEVPPIAVLVEMIRLHCQTLFADNHSIDMNLLYTRPSELVVKYEAMIVHIVNKHVSKNDDWDVEMKAELIANIREKLLQKTANGKLAAQFKEKSSFHHYLYRVIYHNMIDELRKQKKEGKILFIEELSEKKQPAVAPHYMAYSDLIHQHLRWLKALIKGFPIQKQRRFEFALMVVYRIPLNADDIRRLYRNCSDDLLVEILSHFAENYQHLSKTELYKLLNTFVKALENIHNTTQSGAFRIWFQNSLIQIKKTLFKHLYTTKNTSLDTYFELLVYKLYKKN